MKKNDILNILHDKIQTVVISAVNDQLSAVSTIIDLIIENEKIYFILAKGDELFSALEKNQLLYLNGYNQVGTFKQVITMSVKIREIDQDQTNELIGNDIGFGNPGTETIIPKSPKSPTMPEAISLIGIGIT